MITSESEAGTPHTPSTWTHGHNWRNLTLGALHVTILQSVTSCCKLRNEIVGLSEIALSSVYTDSLICDPDTFRVRAIHSELGLARVGASPGQPADHSSHDKWDKALLKIRRPGPRPRTKWHFNGSVLGFEVNISLTSLLSSTACVTSRLCLWTEASCLYAANQSKSNFPSVNNVIVIKLLTLDKILGFGNPLMNYITTVIHSR